MRFFGYLNLIFLFLIGSLLLAAFGMPNKTLDSPSVPILAKELPKSPFSLPEEAYLEMTEGPFNLKWAPPQMRLPDLRKELVFYGKNGRPDAKKNSLLLSFKSSSEIFYAEAGEKIYLTYSGPYAKRFADSYMHTRTQTSGAIWGEINEKKQLESYSFCPKGTTSSLWLEVHSFDQEGKIEVSVNLLDENKHKVLFPEEHRTFILEGIDFPKAHTSGWEIGKYRADTTLLVRQKAKWLGPDLFLKLHGGEEYSDTLGKERLEFLDGPTPYSCYVSEGDFLVWENDRWSLPSDHTFGHPLLMVKKVDEKLMSLELWDPEGKGKINLSLIKARDTSGFPDVTNDFKFVGAKTWAQFIVECRNVRITLKSHDWLVLTQNGWEKLDSPESIDDYVEGRIQGPLFVLEKFSKQNGRQALVGHLFNVSRTEVEQVELLASQTTTLANFCRTIPQIPPIQPEQLGAEE